MGDFIEGFLVCFLSIALAVGAVALFIWLTFNATPAIVISLLVVGLCTVAGVSNVR